jgi:hypothetical protein
MPSNYQKDPSAKLDYMVDWTKWLTREADVISTSTWVVPAGITGEDASNDTLTTTIWISGGTVGTYYTFTNRIQTTTGRINDRSFDILVRNQ